ncbi:GNAT family N-acetyltransferase [Macrococcus hajekii]|uniref:GNAT family N-acetyltransferase n=1 Tax=Macrococcus hajekii TaxID=198482 RepID=A0A4V6PPN5_9STAP|nr:GNAT family N-acetyltransferase [Macrococcus hajekii]TDM01544.1 GNAT family N-acetyltransferase [Macrococcus hajekii]GGB00889.1 N-acetyltransferase [Macrococcus hajekii]
MLKKISIDDPLLKEIAAIHENIPQTYKEWSAEELDYILRFESLRLLLQQGNDHILSLQADHQLIAFIWYSLTDHTYIKSLWVRPTYRGKGYAARLKNKVKEISINSGMPYIAGKVHSDNQNMIALNHKLGYNWDGEKMILKL